jgi:LytS/YehU family sensor histidine kinase
MLLPIVENAIRHGIGPRETPARCGFAPSGMATRCIWTCETTVWASAELPPRRMVAAFGIGSTRARLTQLYGSRPSFTIGQVVPTGTLVTIELPFHTVATGIGYSPPDT